MIYLFSACREDRSGEKMVVAFKAFPKWQDIQTAADADAATLNFYEMRSDLRNVELGFGLGVNKVYVWKYEGFICQIFGMELIDNEIVRNPDRKLAA